MDHNRNIPEESVYHKRYHCFRLADSQLCSTILTPWSSTYNGIIDGIVDLMICFHLVPSLARKSTDKFLPLKGHLSPKWNGQDEKTEDSGVEPLKADSMSITQYIQCTNTSVYPAGCQGRSLIQHSTSTPVCQFAKKNRWYWSHSTWQRFLPKPT
jgi:hypothetical protein